MKSSSVAIPVAKRTSDAAGDPVKEAISGFEYSGTRCFIPVGIDVSADTFDAAVAVDNNHTLRLGSFPNTKTGVKSLILILARLSRKSTGCRVVMEATNVYYRLVAFGIHESGVAEVAVVNPRAAKHFALAQGERAKTDAVDARILALFAERMPCALWSPPDPEADRLKFISRRIGDLTDDIIREKNRLAAARKGMSPACVVSDIESSVKILTLKIDALRKEARKTIDASPSLSLAFSLLLTVIGVGEVTATSLLAEIVSVPKGLTARQWVAMAGLDPKPYESGKSVKKKTVISKQGNKYLRHAVFHAALVISRYDPNANAWKTRLVEKRHKAKMQAIAAVMRKLIVGIHAMFRTNSTFNPALLFPASAS